MPTKPPQRPPWFRLRCAASALLAAGVWAGAARMDLTRQPLALTPPPAASPIAPPPLPDPDAPAIVIDPGHGGKDPGTVAGDHHERTWTLHVGLALADALRRRGWPVLLTRTDDTTVPLLDRSALANARPRLAFVSIHFNAGNPEANGIETFYAWPRNPEIMVRMDAAHRVPPGAILCDHRGQLLAAALQTAACAATSLRDRGVRNAPDLSVLSRTLCPAVLVECGFLTNPAEFQSIQTQAWRDALVTALADALDTWLRAASVPGYGISMEKVAITAPLTPIPGP